MILEILDRHKSNNDVIKLVSTNKRVNFSRALFKAGGMLPFRKRHNRREKPRQFHQRYFLIPKKRWRPDINPASQDSEQNAAEDAFSHAYIAVPLQINQTNYFTTVDVKDAYFQIPKVERHRKYLRFALQEKA